MSKFPRMNQDTGNGSETIRSVIESVGTFLPETDVSTHDILQGCRRHLLVPLERWSGIKSRRMAGTTEFSLDMAERAIARCLEKSRYSARDVELLICCNISKQDESDRFSLEPTTSASLLTKFDFADPVHFDLANACAGLFTGIYLADNLIRQKVFSRVLVVSGEYITHLTRTAQIEIESSRDSRLACLTLGDAAAAVMLEAGTGDAGFRSVQMRSAPEHSLLCIAKTTDKAHGGAIMFTDSMGLNEHATENSVLHTLATLQDANVNPDDVDHWILHQTSQRALRGGAAAFNRALGRRAMHDGNLVDNLGRRGNTASTSHFVALADLIEADRIRSGQNVVFAVQASGITYGTAIYQLDDLPSRLRNGGHHKDAADPHAPGSTPAGNGARPKSSSFQRLSRRIQVEAAAAVLPEGPSENEIQMASRAAKECLSRSKYSASQVDVLIFTGIYRNEFLTEPAVAALVARELGITGAMSAERAAPFFAFDIMNGSLGSLTASWVASNLITGGMAKVAMVVSGECIQKQDGALGIVDAASAFILDAGDGRVGFDSFYFTSMPEHHGVFRSFAITAGGPARLGFNGSLEEVRHLAIPELRRAMERHLEESGLTRDGIGAVLAPQGTNGFAGELADALGMPAHKVIDAGKGNLAASSLAFSLLSTNGHANGKPLLALECAPGLQVGAATYYGSLAKPER